MSESESFIEDELIKQLTTGVSQWTYRKDLKSEDDLWNNIRKQLNENNKSKLNGNYITDEEMIQIKDFIKSQAESPYKAGLWLSGENGLAQIPLKRENAALGEVFLNAIDNKEIAGGYSCYEVIRQYQSDKTDENDRNRRFDVTLLINGFPLIHIELKNQDHSYMEAFSQIKKYIGECKFTGVFGLIQMFVVSNGTDTKYIAAAPYDKFNEKFLSSWVDSENKPVDNYLSFAKEALNIPQAHLMVGKYSVLDSNSKSIVLLRPYQIHAIEAVKQASKNKESGFVWHTTGSGKTLTSFNVARNLLEIPSIDKSVFLIDRKDLDQQTTLSFQSYAQSTGDEIANTGNTKALEKSLKSKDRIVVIATRQKLDVLLDKCNQAITNGDTNHYYYKLAKTLKDKNIAFIVDECHRAISASSKREIEKFFDNSMKKSLWYGFTGTPIFVENKKSENGQDARTTVELYGRCLHQYTIKDALHDHAVLGFQVQNSGFSKNELHEVAKQLDVGTKDELRMMSRDLIESKVLTAYKKKFKRYFYDSKEHRELVIDYICNRSNVLFQLDEPKGTAFEGILTCSSIEIAQKYYEEFKQFVKDGRIKNAVKKVRPDFPKIAITYSLTENEDDSVDNQNKMKEFLNDYNEMFGTNCSIDNNLANYNSDLNERLARKRDKYKIREEQLDLVIVVDRLLTGFDAPCLSTLFIDRQPMSPQGIIQAFSRTNRIYDKRKTWGQIVTFQTPELFKKAYENALQLYSNGGASYVQAPSFLECKQRLIDSLAALKSFKEKPEEIYINKDNKDELKRFVKLYQKFDKALAAVKTYEEWANESSTFEDEVDSICDSNNENCEQIEDDSIHNTVELKMKEKSKLENVDSLSLNRIEVADENQQNSDDSSFEKTMKKITGMSISKDEIDAYVGKYKNALDLIKDDEDPISDSDIDIEYILDTVSDTQVDYGYLVSLIQKYISSGNSNTYAKINDPAIEKYISSMESKNPKLGEVIRGIWEAIKSNPKNFIGKQAIFLINEKIESIISEKIRKFCTEWCVSEMDMIYSSKFYVEGNEMSLDMKYDDYLKNGGTLNKILYKKNVRELAKQLITEEILVLRNR